MFVSIRSVALLVLAIFASNLSVGLASTSLESDAAASFQTYDFNQDKGIDLNEFRALFLALFEANEKRFVAPRTIEKLFYYLNMNKDDRLNSEEYRKIFQHWILPIIAPKTCIFLCVPNDATNKTQLEQKTSYLIEQFKNLFNIHYVYVSSCHVDPRIEQTRVLVSHIEQMLPKAYDIKVYDLDSHRKSLQNKDFDQFVISLANVKHDRNALKELMSLNSVKQHPTVFVADLQDKEVANYLIENHLSNSIIVSPSMNENARERAQYKIDLALILARKIYRKYVNVKPL